MQPRGPGLLEQKHLRALERLKERAADHGYDDTTLYHTMDIYS